MKTDSFGCPGIECSSSNLYRTWVGLRREYWLRRLSQNRSFQLMAAPERCVFERALHDTEDIEEFPLLLQSGDVSALIEAARPQGLCAAGLARLVIRDYLLRIRRDSAKTGDDDRRQLAGGEKR